MIKSKQHPDFCPKCNKPYTFPLDDKPDKIDGRFKIIDSINRGFYGATYLVEHPITKGKFTFKLIPKEIYAHYKKNFYKEIENYQLAANLDINIPKLIDAGEISVLFADTKIDCYFIQMEYIDGYSLKDFKNSSELNANKIAQVIYDLFDFLRKIEIAGLHHNDLHDGNIIIQFSSGEKGRLDAIDRTVKAYVIDLGSADDNERSSEQHSRDVTWTVRHFKDMLDSYWDRANQDEQRVLSRLNEIIITCSGREQVREINFEEYCNRIKSDVKQGEAPWAYPKELITPGDYYNAQLMPIYYSSHLIFDPADKWKRNLTKPGPILLTGMRGCGKTILLMSLHFMARAQQGVNETKVQMVERLGKEKHVALFVSASTLLTDPKSKELHLPNHKLILAFSENLIRCIRFCEIESIGKINYDEIARLCTNLKELIPWFESPSSDFNTLIIEERIEEALLKARKINKDDAGELNVHDAFDILAKRIQGCIDIWINKHVIYLLDDLSVRYLTQDNIDELLSQLCHQAERFSFKISTETPTLRLKTGAGKVCRLDRDYEEFDLGNEVMHQLKSSAVSFMENVLKKRVDLTHQYKGLSPTDLLGNQSYIEIAKNLAGSNPGKRRGSYWGISALGVLSTGDIGDSIHMFNKMLEKSELDTQNIIPKNIQDSVIFDYSEKKLRKLARDNKWFYDHAVSFAQASQLELRESYGKKKLDNNIKIRQYNEVFLRIDPNEAEDIFNKINELVEGGVFVFAGGTPRSKTPGKKASLFLKLAFRKILGVTNLMPISFRDRFELSGKDLEDWLEEPTAYKLRKTVSSTNSNESSEEISDWNWNDLDEQDSNAISSPGSPFVQQSLEEYIIPKKGIPDKVCDIPYTVESSQLREMENTDIVDKYIIGALGFEDRSIGTWRNILRTGKPKRVTLIEYRNESNKESIIKLLKEANIAFDIIPYEKVISRGLQDIDRDVITQFVKEISFDHVVLDVTSLIKPLIFLLTSEILKQKKELGIIHTNADKYFPNEEEIADIMPLLHNDEKQFFEKADDLVKGELEPQSKMVIWQNRNPSSEVYLICFLSLKFLRVKKLLEELPVNFLSIIYPLSTDGEDSARSRFAREIAQSFVSESGFILPTEYDDHVSAFKILKDSFIKYSLEFGLNFELGLTGVKMHIVAAGMLASIANLSGIYYTPVSFEPSKYTKGTGKTTYTNLKIRNVVDRSSKDS